MSKKEIFKAFEQLKVLVIGDVMIDRYLVGKVERISPEAPVPVVNLERQDNRLGGAANVALNLKSLGAKPFLCSVVGQDETAETFQQLMQEEGLSSEGILKDKTRITTLKTRVLAKNQQLLRFDSEVKTAINDIITGEFIRLIQSIIDKHEISVVLFQDYNKGVLTPEVITSIIDFCNSKHIPTTADPKHENFFAYKNITLFKPNLKEVSDALGMEVNPSDSNSLEEAVSMIHTRLNNPYTLITLSEKGVYLHDGEGVIIPTKPRHIADVCGAGDTVISVVSLGLALGLGLEQTCQLANLAGGIVCESVGVTPVDKNKLMAEFEAMS